jgi:hypothetical protein
MLDTWGMNTLKHSVKALSNLRDSGGHTALAASVFWDDRYTALIFSILVNANVEYGDLAEYVTQQSHNGGIPLISLYAALADHAPPHISAAVKYSSQYWFSGQKAPFWLPRIPLKVVSEARSTIDNIVPGLSEMIAGALEFRGLTQEEDASFMGPAIFNIDASIFDSVEAPLRGGS